jgi:hypothetical protein
MDWNALLDDQRERLAEFVGEASLGGSSSGGRCC